MSIRIALLGLSLAALCAPAQAETIEGTVETELVKGTNTTPNHDLVFVKTAAGRYRVDDPAMKETLYRFKRKRVSLEGSVQTVDEAQVLSVTKIVSPVRWIGVRGAVSRTRPGKKRFSPRFTPLSGPAAGKTLRVFGRSYFPMKRLAKRSGQAVIRGWYFARTGEVCVTAVRGEALRSRPMLKGLEITGRVAAGETVWIHATSLTGLRLLIENRKGEVGHVMDDEARIGEPARTRAGKRGLKQAVEPE